MRIPPRLAKPALALASTAATLAAVELALRWHVDRGGAPEPGADVAFVPDEEIGYRLNPAYPGNNALGLTSPPVESPKPAGRVRTIVLGDSIAWEPEGLVDLLREKLARTRAASEVVNGCVPGYTTHQERVFLERTLLGLEPDLVLLEYCLNDNHRFLHRLDPQGRKLFTPEAKRALLGEAGGLADRLTRWSYLAVEIRRRLAARRLRASGAPPWESREDVSPAWRDETWGDLEANVVAMRDAARARGADFAVVAFPIEDQVEFPRLAESAERVLAPQRHLSRICSAAGVPSLDLFGPFLLARRAGTELFTDGLHLTPAAHALAAEEIARFLAREGLPRPAR